MVRQHCDNAETKLTVRVNTRVVVEILWFNVPQRGGGAAVLIAHSLQ